MEAPRQPVTGPIDIALVCALRCEGRPLLDKLSLSPVPGEPGLHWNGTVAMAIAGVGVDCAARAVHQLSTLADSATCWLNLGCAGGVGELGELVVAHRVSSENGDSWYPQFPFAVEQATGEVRTVARPETRYSEPVLYDMEAAGFYAQALAAASLERVHVLKVRVDGPGRAIENLSAAVIEQSIASHTPALVSWLERLAEVAIAVRGRRPPRAGVDSFLYRWHFTVSQGIQLTRVLERLNAMQVEVPDAAELGVGSAQGVLRILNQRLREDGAWEGVG